MFGRSRPRARVGAAALAAAVLAAGLPAARAAIVDVTLEPTVKSFLSEVAPGSRLYVWGADWLPPNCASKIHLRLRDSGGETFSLGRFAPVNPLIVYEGQEYPAALEASPTIPDGVRPGPAKVWGKQDWSFRFPGLGCFELARITSKKSSFTIRGESGNDPPRISGFQVADLLQGQAGPIRWTSSEPCAATMELEYRLAPGMPTSLPAPLVGHASVAGANSVPFDATSEGRALPAGEYQASMQCQEPGGARSAVARDDFTVAFAP